MGLLVQFHPILYIFSYTIESLVMRIYKKEPKGDTFCL